MIHVATSYHSTSRTATTTSCDFYGVIEKHNRKKKKKQTNNRRYRERDSRKAGRTILAGFLFLCLRLTRAVRRQHREYRNEKTRVIGKHAHTRMLRHTCYYGHLPASRLHSSRESRRVLRAFRLYRERLCVAAITADKRVNEHC